MISHQLVSATGVTVPTTVETVAVTTPVPDGLQRADRGLIVKGVVYLTAGTAATAATVRVRKGVGAGGAVVGPAIPITVAAGNTVPLPFHVVDAEAGSGQAQYTVTVTQTTATGNGSIAYAAAEVSGAYAS